MKPRLWGSNSEPLQERPSMFVYEDDDPVDTGLVGAQGNPIYRVKQKEPMGFRRRTE